MTQTIRFAAWQFAWLMVVAWVAPATAVEMPRVVGHSPGAGEEYGSGARIVCAGKVEPAIRSDVEIRMFHELPTGELALLCGVTVAQDRSGAFRATVSPPSSGWRPGNVLIEARLVDLQQVLLHCRIRVTADNRPGPGEALVRLPDSSGVVIDTAQHRQAVVEAGKSFLVRGSFRAAFQPGRIEGPFVTSKIIAHFGRNPLILQSAHSRSLVEEGDGFGYELRIVAPKESGNYLLTLEVQRDRESEQKGLPPVRWVIDLKVVAPRPKPQT
jgi:hypothetical protein